MKLKCEEALSWSMMTSLAEECEMIRSLSDISGSGIMSVNQKHHKRDRSNLEKWNLSRDSKMRKRDRR